MAKQQKDSLVALTPNPKVLSKQQKESSVKATKRKFCQSNKKIDNPNG